MNVVFNCDYAGMSVARYICEGEQLAPGHTLLALAASCTRGRRYLRVFLAFALRSKGIIPKQIEPADAFVKRMFVLHWNTGRWSRECGPLAAPLAAPLQVQAQQPRVRARVGGTIPLHPLLLGRWPWLPKTPVVPPQPTFLLHCCAIDGDRPKLMAFAGVSLGREPGSAMLQVRVPDALPRHSRDPVTPTTKFVGVPFDVQGQRIGVVAAMRWTQTTAHTLLILSVATPREGGYLVVFRVDEAGLLSKMHSVFWGADRTLRVLGPSDETGGHFLYNRQGVHFWDSLITPLALPVHSAPGGVALECLNAIRWKGNVCAATRAAVYRVSRPRSPQGPPRVREAYRLDYGVEFVGPMCPDKEGVGLILLCKLDDGDGLRLIRYDSSDLTVSVLCNFPDDQEYKPDHAMGVLESGSVVLCGCDTHLVFSRNAQGVYAQPKPLKPWHTSSVIQTALVYEGPRVRSVLALHDNGLVNVWGEHPAVALFRPARGPKY